MIRYLIFVFIGFVLFASFTTPGEKKEKEITTTTTPIVEYRTTGVNIPFLLKDFVGFKEALAFKESQGRYRVINKLGYLGKYQFGKETLKRFRIYNTNQFLKNPELQEKAFIAYCKVNKWILRKDIRRSVGKTINGVKITESGILAAAHLSGAGNVKKYLRSNGVFQFNDAFGTSIQSYMKKFAGYDVSNITANKKPTV
ncbi:peptidoglycan-binding protein LysM [Tenacibaculum sp. Cn5-34]|uniref:peptidoglycan-binding protein LysM n=1 Tax=uncultured Tenacibaculum sp. TaxID=174713 RepID=UPI001F446F7A|nr:peptidoglycan-binding protein LysM [Tenacibaculum sp. Cn5-34]MCF2873960.1 peptidoglycan-binding protein LysM [Tenacibaculum sp. Cn5-1]MCF2934541.1 peptidoglycan-binding protein LysM [Tenacibaculum sp. Cn5-34]MCG7510751.1 peptidoglycan-binding protein LysM [Tenacibaculum sp. Cn5-46]